MPFDLGRRSVLLAFRKPVKCHLGSHGFWSSGSSHPDWRYTRAGGTRSNRLLNFIRRLASSYLSSCNFAERQAAESSHGGGCKNSSRAGVCGRRNVETPRWLLSKDASQTPTCCAHHARRKLSSTALRMVDSHTSFTSRVITIWSGFPRHRYRSESQRHPRRLYSCPWRIRLHPQDKIGRASCREK